MSTNLRKDASKVANRFLQFAAAQAEDMNENENDGITGCMTVDEWIIKRTETPQYHEKIHGAIKLPRRGKFQTVLLDTTTSQGTKRLVCYNLKIENGKPVRNSNRFNHSVVHGADFLFELASFICAYMDTVSDTDKEKIMGSLVQTVILIGEKLNIQ